MWRHRSVRKTPTEAGTDPGRHRFEKPRLAAAATVAWLVAAESESSPRQRGRLDPLVPWPWVHSEAARHAWGVGGPRPPGSQVSLALTWTSSSLFGGLLLQPQRLGRVVVAVAVGVDGDQPNGQAVFAEIKVVHG